MSDEDAKRHVFVSLCVERGYREDESLCRRILEAIKVMEELWPGCNPRREQKEDAA